MESHLCDYGCGQEAKFFFNNGKKCCESKWCKCSEARRKLRIFMKENNPLKDLEIRERQRISNGKPECREKKRKYALEHNPMYIPEVREKHKNKMKNDMSGKNNPLYTVSDALENLRKAERSQECRKKKSESTKLAFIEGRHPMCFPDIVLRMSESNSKPIEHIKEFENYQHKVIKETNKSLIKHKKEIRNYELRGRKHGYELDHKYSISKGFKNNIDSKILGHWKNLEILLKEENGKKYIKCSITLDDLLNQIKESEE